MVVEAPEAPGRDADSTKRVRVIHVGPERAGRGGMAAVLRELALSPLARRYRVEYLTTYRHADGAAARVLAFAVSLIKLAAWCLGRGSRIVHIHAAVRGSWYRKGVVVALVRLLRRPVVLQVHSGAVDIAAFWGSLGPLRRRLLTRGMGSADQVLSVSRAGADALHDLVGLQDVMVIGNPAPRPFAASPTDNTVDHDGRVRILYLGGFANRAKGGHVLLEALPTLLAGDDVEVVMAGPGELPVSGSRLLGENPHVRWVSWLDDQAKAAELASADVVVFPSISEGLPIALLEAMVAGRAVVAARTGGMPEVLTHERDALLVDAGDSAGLAAAVASLVSDPDARRRLGAAAADRAARLNHDEVYRPLEQLYSRLTTEGSRRRAAKGREADTADGGDAARRLRVLLVCSPGGHLQQMLALSEGWQDFEVSWATLDGRDVEHLLADKDVSVGHGPTNRSLVKFLRNITFAYRVLTEKRPDAILSTGAGLAVPFFLLGRLKGCRLVYVESLTRTEGLSLSGRMVAPFAHSMFVQWPGAMTGRTRYVGSILSSSGEEDSSAESVR